MRWSRAAAASGVGKKWNTFYTRSVVLAMTEEQQALRDAISQAAIRTDPIASVRGPDVAAKIWDTIEKKRAGK